MSFPKKLPIALALLLSVPAPAYAQQSAEAQARAAINQAGHACPEVTHLEGVGVVESGDILIGAVCSDGGRWVLQVHNNSQIVNVLECWALESAGAELPFCRQYRPA
jgi:hypothetical protein